MIFKDPVNPTHAEMKALFVQLKEAIEMDAIDEAFANMMSENLKAAAKMLDRVPEQMMAEQQDHVLAHDVIESYELYQELKPWIDQHLHTEGAE